MTDSKPLRTIPHAYKALLSRVIRPGRYTGGEANCVVKDPESLRASIALAFPDLYDLGMSYHGFRILYERVNNTADFAAERVYTPWTDYADALRESKLPLTSLENFRPLNDFEVIGFTLQHELNYTNVLETLDLGDAPIHSSERVDPFPLVIAGGEGAYSPEAMAAFIDAFVLGDGEEVVMEILELAARAREEEWNRPQLLEALAKIKGVYVPAFYDVEYKPDGTIASVRPNNDTAPECVKPRLYDISKDPGPTRPLTPIIRTVQDRTVVEIRRGCVHGCRFCHAGMINRPVRERPLDQIVETAKAALEHTGDDSLTLLSLSTADYSLIRPLVKRLNTELRDRNISVSLPSLRINSFDVELASEVSAVRKSGFTFAPEAASEALRRRINKPVDEAEFLKIVGQVLESGWRTIKFYFMIGLPGETEDDLDGIVELTRKAMVQAVKRGIRGIKINVSLSPFVPKPHTPFQWEGQISEAEMRHRIHYVRSQMPRGVDVKTSPVATSRLEAILARGDRKLAAAIESAWRKGCRFDGWRESFQPELWWEAFEECGIDPEFYASRERADDEIFPYDHLLVAPGRKFLEAERDASRRGDITPDCVENPCARCAACNPPKQHVLAKDTDEAGASGILPAENAPDSSTPGPSEFDERTPAQIQEDMQPVMRARLRFTKYGALAFVSHLDLTEAIHRIVRRSSAPVAYSQGYNPQPRISLTPPLPLGFEGEGELADVLLLERIDLAEWLRQLRAISAPDGLQWTAIEEAPVKSPSLQQTVEYFDYEISWKRSAAKTETTLPLDADVLYEKMQGFMECEEWPIEIMRKGRPQKRDARGFVEECEVIEKEDGWIGLELRMRSTNGATLNPLLVLEHIFEGKPERGVWLHVVRKAIQL